MNANVKNEEVTALGDFILTSYARDFDVIKSKFTKMNAVFRDEFIAKLTFVKQLEGSLVLTERQKGVTASLCKEAKQLNDELNFLSAYFKDALLNTSIVTDLKTDLFSGNIEGVLLKIENLKQFIVVHQTVLVAEGMDAGFATALTNYKVGMTAKNIAQNEIINNRKQLTNGNQSHYKALLKIIRKIVRNGKVVFKGTVTQDEYTAIKVIERMRAAKRKNAAA